MAEEIKETPEVEVSPKKKKGIPMVAIIAGVAVLALGGGLLVGKILGGKGGSKPNSPAVTQPKEANKEAAAGAEKTPGTGKEVAAAGENGNKAGLLDLEEFTVNLIDPFGRRYANLLISLEIESRDLVAKIKADELLIPKIRDQIFSIISAKTKDDMTSVAGKIALKEEIMIRVNEIIKQSLSVEPVKSVLFNKFLIQ